MSEVLVHRQPSPWLWAQGEADQHGRTVKSPAEESYSAHGVVRSREKEGRRGLRVKAPF